MPEVRPIEAMEDALFEGSCTEFLPNPEGWEEGVCLLAGRDARKEDALGSPENGPMRGVYEVPPLLLPCFSRPATPSLQA